MIEYTNSRNPILPLDIHIPDGEAHVMPDGKLYVYGSFDAREDQYCSGEYRVVSTPDMLHWTVHGKSFDGIQVGWFFDPDAPKYPGIDWAHPTPFIRKMLEERAADKEAFEKPAEGEKPALLYAPDCAHKNGRYYLYFCLADDSEGVAVSDRPEGPFRDPVRLPIGGIDPAVFVDNDGSAYYYWGQLFSHGVKLNDDMQSFDRDGVVDDLVTEEKHFFHEGSSMRRIGDTYYYVYADMERGKPTSLGYSTGSSPLGPFKYRGIIIDNADCDPQSWNNHGSIECFNGQWYIFYHRSSRNGQLHRRLCVEKINILPDGTIPEVKMTSQGAGEPFAPGEKIMGYQACEVHGVCYIDTDAEFGEKLTNMIKGSTAVFRYIKSGKPWAKISVEAAGSGVMTVCMNGKATGSIKIDGKEGEYAHFEAPISMNEGEYELTLRVEEADHLEIGALTVE